VQQAMLQSIEIDNTVAVWNQKFRKKKQWQIFTQDLGMRQYHIQVVQPLTKQKKNKFVA
jgi:hypothetical protein